MQTMLWVLYVYFFISFSTLIIFLIIMGIQKAERDKRLAERHLPDIEQNDSSITNEENIVYTNRNTEHTGDPENTEYPDESTDDDV